MAKRKTRTESGREEGSGLPWTQKQVLLFEKLALLGQLLSSVAHEINSPIATALGGIENLKRNYEGLCHAGLNVARAGLSEEDSQTLLELFEAMAENIESSSFLPPDREKKEAADLAARAGATSLADIERDCLVIVRCKLNARCKDVIDLMMRCGEDTIREFFSAWGKFFRNMKNVHAAARRVADTVEALQVYSHPGTIRAEEVDVNTSIENTIVILQGRLRKGTTLDMDLKADRNVLANRAELSQVWMNLLLNAIDSVAGRGAIRVQTFCRAPHTVVRVIDNGPGIPEENRAQLFEPFFTTKTEGEGTGLGLWITKQIVDKYGGEIEVESAPGNTAFTVRIPQAP
jgi:C4-dicarboxylate-specific signal transduction histidine kinase